MVLIVIVIIIPLNKMGLKTKVYQYLKDQYPRVVHKGELGKLAVVEWNYENENLGRRCRELCGEGLIERILDIKGRVMYRWAPDSNIKKIKIINNQIRDNSQMNCRQELLPLSPR